MDNTYDAVTKILAVKNIRPSFHRVKVLEYLLTCKDHPAAFAIFDALSPLIPSLSRSTVYNCIQYTKYPAGYGDHKDCGHRSRVGQIWRWADSARTLYMPAVRRDI